MFGDGSLSFNEFVIREPQPLAIVQRAVLEFLKGRDDVVLFGAQAVNAYVKETRSTEDVDVMSIRASELAEEIREHLAREFYMAARVRKVAGGKGYRVYQLQEPENRHLVDVRVVGSLPASNPVHGILVLQAHELIAMKVIAYEARRYEVKSGTDLRDLMALLLTFPELKSGEGPVADALKKRNASAKVLEEWQRIVESQIRPTRDELEQDF